MIEEQCYADTSPLTLFNLKQEGKIPSHESLYDTALKHTVELAYADDIALYNNHFQK